MAEDLSEVFRANVTRVMSLKKLSQADLAEKLGVSQPRVCQVVSGTSDVAISTVSQYARALNTTPASLLTQFNRQRGGG